MARFDTTQEDEFKQILQVYDEKHHCHGQPTPNTPR